MSRSEKAAVVAVLLRRWVPDQGIKPLQVRQATSRLTVLAEFLDHLVPITNNLEMLLSCDP